MLLAVSVHVRALSVLSKTLRICASGHVGSNREQSQDCVSCGVFMAGGSIEVWRMSPSDDGSGQSKDCSSARGEAELASGGEVQFGVVMVGFHVKRRLELILERCERALEV